MSKIEKRQKLGETLTKCNWHFNFFFKEFKFYCKACGELE